MPVDRGGASLLEVVVSLLCAIAIVQLALGGLDAARGVSDAATRTTERLDALRVARTSLRETLRAGIPGRDWDAFPPDSVRARAFRGVARVCTSAPGEADLVVAWEGARWPEPAKDSLLLLDEHGAWTTAGLLTSSASMSTCASGSTRPVLDWSVSPPLARGAVLARLYEPVSFHLADRALRLRVGRGGRQPLTPTVLSSRGSGFVDGPEGLGIHLESGGDGGWSWVGSLAAGR